MKNLLDFSLEELKLWMRENKEKEFRAKQIMDWVYKEKWNFNDMINIPKSTREKMQENFYISIPKIERKNISKKGDTIKFLLEYSDGNVIESVVMKYEYGNSICISTQVGCRMGCKFCASTIGGRIRNLSSGEILGEILSLQKEIGERISNIVLMGSGEPFDNYENVIKFIRLVNSKNGLNIGQRHITLSTCGIIPKIQEFSKEQLQVTLAISLHAPNDQIRKTMMPIANKYSIEELIEACKEYIKDTKRRVTFEYALVNGVNDNEECAEKLSELLKGMLCHVNLIPINEVKENKYKKSTQLRIKKFTDILVKKGIETTVRKEMGSDIDAACGQLRRSYIKEKEV